MAVKNIYYNDTDNTIVINDDIKFTYNMYRFVIVATITIGSSLQLVNLNKYELNIEIIIYSIIGAFSVIAGLFLYLKRSTQQKIPIDTIKGLSRSNVLNGNNCYIKLKNGKKRELPDVKTKDEFKELQKMLESSGVEV